MGIDLDEIYEAARNDSALDSMREPGRKLVPGRGAMNARVFIISRAPDAMEQLKGKLLVGKVGKALRSLIEDVAEIPDDYWWCTTLVKYHLTGNRTPTRPEIDASLPHLRREWAAVGKPGVIVCVGGTALSTFGPETSARAMKAIGQPSYGGPTTVIWAMMNVADAQAKLELRASVEEHWTALGEWLRKGEVIPSAEATA